jgi:DnaJ-domain-containing protein 1
MAILWALVAAGALYLGFAIVRVFIGRRDGMRLGHWRDAGIGLILVGGPLAVLAGAAPWTAAAGVWVLPAIAFLIDRRLFLPLLFAGRDEDGPLLRTRFLSVTLDPDTDALDGNVIRGRFEGRRLSDLSPDQMDALMSEVSSDPDSVGILSGIFLQFGEESRQGEDRAKSGAGRGGRRRAGAGEGCGGKRRGTSMNVEEAYRVLGVVSGASETEILAAHRRLMKMVHPDTGGSDYLASKINEARDLLLGR